jgi:hypothetical protein
MADLWFDAPEKDRSKEPFDYSKPRPKLVDQQFSGRLRNKEKKGRCRNILLKMLLTWHEFI